MAENTKEYGTIGLEALGGWIRAAYDSRLYWPTVAPLYDKIWRSDPEVTTARLVMSSMGSKLDAYFETPSSVENPTADDQAAVDFGNEILADIDGGFNQWLSDCIARVPFYGFGWWEIVPGLRRKGWRPPDDDDWRSQYDDGLLGIRRLAFRHYTSFYGWEMNDRTGRVTGFVQMDPPNPTVTIPRGRSLHVVFGDMNNPEGLATLETIWRLEKIKYGFEIILGIGFEHAAGHVSVKAEKDLSPGDQAQIRAAVRSLLAAQEGNYAAWPKGYEGSVIDVPFQAAGSLLDSIRYFGILKLATVAMQWAALGTLSPYGSYSSMKDASEFFLVVFNSMAEGFIKQVDEQMGRRLFEHPTVTAKFPDITERPRLVVTKAQKLIGLDELGSFIGAFTAAGLPLGDEDVIAIRRKADFLPEVLPEIETEIEEEEEEEEEAGTDEIDETGDGLENVDVEDEEEDAELIKRPFTVGDGERPIALPESDAYITETDIKRAIRSFERWAKENEPEVAGLLRAKVIPTDGGKTPAED